MHSGNLILCVALFSGLTLASDDKVPSRFVPSIRESALKGLPPIGDDLEVASVTLSWTTPELGPSTEVKIAPRVSAGMNWTDSPGPTQTVNLNQAIQNTPADINTALNFIAQAPAGAEMIQAFLPKFRSGEIQILPMTSQHIWDHKVDADNLAHIVYANGKRIIYLRNGIPLGVLARVLTEEIAHSLDEDHVAATPEYELLKEKAQKLVDAKTKILRDMLAARRYRPTDDEQQELARADRVAAEFESARSKRVFRSERRANAISYVIWLQLQDFSQGYADYFAEMAMAGHISVPLTEAYQIFQVYKEANPAHVPDDIRNEPLKGVPAYVPPNREQAAAPESTWNAVCRRAKRLLSFRKRK